MEKKRCIGCMMLYPKDRGICPFCKCPSDAQFNQPVFDALPLCSIVENLRIGLVVAVERNCITYAGLDLRDNKRIIIREFFAQGYMLRRDDGSVALAEPRYDDIVRQEMDAFCRSAKKYIRANGTVYAARRRWSRPVRRPDRPPASNQAALRSIVGARERQEDAAGLLHYDDGIFAVLCDGMGGRRAGETASAECVRIMTEISDTVRYCHEGMIPAVLRRQAVLADRYIASLRDMDENRLNCGTTLLCAVIRGGSMCFISAGDSHIYLIHEESICLLTEEHTYLAELTRLAERGEMDYEDAIRHPRRDALTSYIGIGHIEKLHVAQSPLRLAEGDRILMCSDGLYRALSDWELLDIVVRHPAAGEAAEALLLAVEQKALPKQDNATLILYQFKTTGGNGHDLL